MFVQGGISEKSIQKNCEKTNNNKYNNSRRV